MTKATTTRIQLSTTDGPCTVEVSRPDGAAKLPAVIVFFDAAGLRPAMTHIAERIAASGYHVFQPDLFHRSPPLEGLFGGEVTLAALMKVFADERREKFISGYYAPALDYANLQVTVGALLDHIAGRDDVETSTGVRMTGYCMGGNASVRAATVFGTRIGVTAAFHPGGLVTDQPTSPHLRARTIKSRLYLAPATGDLPADAEAALRAELDAGAVRYEIEHYDAKHGYAVEDSAVYDAAAAAKHYAALERWFRAV
jgi:carboxymethylenebutenolidase